MHIQTHTHAIATAHQHPMKTIVHFSGKKEHTMNSFSSLLITYPFAHSHKFSERERVCRMWVIWHHKQPVHTNDCSKQIYLMCFQFDGNEWILWHHSDNDSNKRQQKSHTLPFDFVLLVLVTPIFINLYDHWLPIQHFVW